MKLSLILFTMGITTLLATPGNAQPEKVNLELKNVTVREVFKEIEKQSNYVFFYNDQFQDLMKIVSVSTKEQPISDILNSILRDTDLTWKVFDNNLIVITPVQDQILLTGTVTDNQGKPLPGVSIVIQGTTIGTNTTAEGNFLLSCPSDSRFLEISFIGMKTQVISIDGRPRYDIVLEEDLQYIDEVQVIGYGTTTRRLSTSSIVSVKTEVLEKQSVANPMEALQGRASGLYITNTAGSFGAMPTVQIRGVSTLSSGVPIANQPLYVVDGAIIPGSGIVASSTDGALNGILGNYWGQEAGMNPFNFLNPNDIESIEVLKDADATSIYGSRGTNGVIIITTKKGKAGATKFNVDFNTGITQASFLPKRMSTEQFLQMRTDAFAMGNYTTTNPINPIAPTASTAPDLLTWAQDAYTDWESFEYRNPARNQSFQGNMSGGTRLLNFFTSLGYNRNEEFTRGDPFQQRLSSLLSMNHSSLNDRLKISLSNNVALDKQNPSHGAVTFPAALRRLPPNMPMANDDGTPFWPTTALAANPRGFLVNPYAGDYLNAESETFSFIGNINASYQLLDFLTLRLQTGYTNQLNKSFTTTPSTSINPFVSGASFPNRSETETHFETINFEPQINIKTNIGKGIFDGLLGTTFFEKNTETFGIQIDGYDSDELLGSWAGGSNVYNNRSTFFKYRFNSVFARANYIYDGKYLVNATYRRDGSSRFGPDNKWANFASIGLGWIFTEESFLTDNNILSFGKLRGSYGTTGNDNIPDFRFTSLFTSTSVIYGDLIGLVPSFLSVPGFKWELTTKMDFAMVLGFLNDRFLVNVDWFRNLSTDLLVNQRVPTQTGFESYLGNFPGVIENKGWEIELVTNNLSPNSALKWKTNFNISLLENTLLEYPDLENSPNSNTYRIGEAIPNPAFPTNLARPLIFEGVDPDTGLPIYSDINEDGTISTFGFNDREFIGSTFPKYYGGINNSFSYKGFTLDVFIYFAKQKTTNHLYLAPTAGQLYNPVADYAGNYWIQPGDEVKYPRLWTGVGAQNALLSSFHSSSAAVDEVFFAKVRNMSISYKLPEKWLQGAKIGDVSVYARGQNLFTYVSKEIHKDPETMNPRGITPRIFLTGINVSF